MSGTPNLEKTLLSHCMTAAVVKTRWYTLVLKLISECLAKMANGEV